MHTQHQALAEGGWTMLTLSEQLGNVGSEVSRALKARGNKERYQSAITRAFELMDLTIADNRWNKRLKELARVREVMIDTTMNGSECYQTTLDDLDRYFFQFAMASRLSK